MLDSNTMRRMGFLRRPVSGYSVRRAETYSAASLTGGFFSPLGGNSPGMFRPPERSATPETTLSPQPEWGYGKTFSKMTLSTFLGALLAYADQQEALDTKNQAPEGSGNPVP